MELFQNELYSVKFWFKWIYQGTQVIVYLTGIPSDFPSGSGGQYSDNRFELLTKWSTVETV